MTCRAILHRDRIEWLDAPPHEIENAWVEVVFPAAPPAEPVHQGREIAALLEKLAELDPFRDIDDPVAWQREIREDVKQPGRD